MNLHQKLIIVCLATLPYNIHAQSDSYVKPDYAVDAKSHIGFGAGLDYGGFGARFTYLPATSVGLFGGVGYGRVLDSMWVDRTDLYRTNGSCRYSMECTATMLH